MTILEAWEKAKEGDMIYLGKFCFIEKNDSTVPLKLSMPSILSNDWEIKKEKKTGWVNIYKFKVKNKDPYHGYYLGLLETEEQAKKYGKWLDREFVARVKIEWEE